MAPRRNGRGGAPSSAPAPPSSAAAGGGLIYVDPERVRFQHSRIRPYFSGCGRSVAETLQSIRDGALQPSDLPPIQVIVGTNDGSATDSMSAEPCYVSLNNRRLWVLKQCRREGMLEGNRIAVRVRAPRSAAEAERYRATHCALEATIMREARREPKSEDVGRMAGADAAGLDDEVTSSDEDSGHAMPLQTAPESDDGSSFDSEQDGADPTVMALNRFGTLEIGSDDDDDEPDDACDQEVSQTNGSTFTCTMPSSVLGDSVATNNASTVIRSDGSKLESMTKDEKVKFDHEHVMCVGMTLTTDVIDNSSKVYISQPLTCGVTAMCAPDVLAHFPQVLHDLESDLSDCLAILPRNLHSLVRRTRLWVNRSYQFGPRHDPVVVNHTTAHHHPGWLAWAHDRVDKTHGIEIYNCVDYQRMRLHWNGCGLILHELCHIIHQFALPGGLDNVQVIKAYAVARGSGLYENVRRRDWAGKDEDFDLAYAMVDWKEFFSEMSVSFWSTGYKELDRQDGNQLLLCSPPIIEPTVLERIRSRSPEQARDFEERHRAYGENWLQDLFPFGRKKVVLCNKFYPFTNGQLKHYDPRTHEEMRQLWDKIADWRDLSSESGSCSESEWCWIPPLIRKEPSASFSDTVNL